MQFENRPLNNVPDASLEALKETYKRRLQAILEKQLTVENIETFADEALAETVQLIDDILIQYKNNPEFKGNMAFDTQKQEDEAFTLLGLMDVQEILQSIIAVRDSIDALKTYIQTNAENIDSIITPPQPDYSTEAIEGAGRFERKIFPRLLTLLYILEHDFDIPPTDVHITQGAVTPKMIRATPYVRVEIPDLNRAMYICDEEGNVSYVFDTAKLRDAGLTFEVIDVDNKRDKNALIAYYPGIGMRIIQTKNWRENVATVLREAILTVKAGIPEEREAEEREKVSEFKERIKFLPFGDFQTEVRSVYHGQGDVYRWYKKERKKHSGWPSAPQQMYKNKGWEGLSELVGRENFMKKEWLSFIDFQTEVSSVYTGQGNVQKWYHEERKKHSDWPYHPQETYKNKGWEGFSELVGKENPFKKDYLIFLEFQTEVRSVYPGQGDVYEWYKKERKKHSGWPSAPEQMYKNKGWKGWSELVGREKKNFSPFLKFQTEVRSVYPGQGNVYKWYWEEQKNHHDWPSAPDQMYKNKGWEGWPQLVGKK